MKAIAPELPISRTTELITIRSAEGREVFTYSDLAAGLQVKDRAVRQAFANNTESWSDDETGVSKFSTASGAQEVRWFTARGAMRFCRHIKSGRSDALFTHLLDLWEATRQGPVAPTVTDPNAAITNLANVLGIALPGMNTAIAAADAKATEALALASAIDPAKMTQDAAAILRWEQARAAKLRPQLEKLCQRYGEVRELNGFGPKVAETIDLNKSLKRTVGKRDLLTMQQLETAIEFVKGLIADMPAPPEAINFDKAAP